MIKKFNNSLINKNILSFLIISIIAFTLNFYYANLGVFPIDTFLHYDSAYKILNNEFPIRDYWIVSGIFVDFLQSFFFLIFGVNWKAYIIHSSVINLLVSILTYVFFLNLNLKKNIAIIYTICFSLLAYPVSGTPFVDLHATFFSLIAVYLTIFAIINSNSNLIWVLVIFFYFLAFFSKQTPTAYLIILNALVLTPYFFFKKKIKLILVIIFSSLFFLFIIILILKSLNIQILDFYIQYIDYPREIGFTRLENLNFSIIKFFNNFKFILLIFTILTIVKLKKLFTNKINFFSKDILVYYILSSVLISFLVHQLLTKNQIFIYFLIPIFSAYFHSEMKEKNYKKKIIITLTILFTILITFKYHLRYNELRKFHELSNTNLSKAVSAKEIDEKLLGLKWISPFYEGEPSGEINLIKDVVLEIELKQKNIVLITHYLFLDSLIEKSLYNLNRTYTLDGASMPLKNTKYYDFYKIFIQKKLLKNNIEEIYFIKKEGLSEELITNYIDKKCLKNKENKIFNIYEINQNCIEEKINTSL
jgi:hypothetical protein